MRKVVHEILRDEEAALRSPPFSFLLVRAMQGTPYDATERLSEAYGLYANAIFRHCWFQTFNREDAEELMQETFMRAWEYLSCGNRIENMKTFLYRVANNLVVDAMRRRKRKRKEEVSLEELQERGFDLGASEIEHIQEKLEAWKILLTLEKKDDYKLLVMRYLEGLHPAEIASITGLTANVVSVRLHRALKDISKAAQARKDAMRQRNVAAFVPQKRNSTMK